MAEVFSLAGFAGTALVAVAYAPQVYHIARERCSAGISMKAWAIWLAASVIFLAYAVSIADAVFITLQALNILAISAVVFFSWTYKNSVCTTCVDAINRKARASGPAQG